MTAPKDPEKYKEFCNKIGNIVKKRWEDPEYKLQMSKKLSNGWEIKREERPQEYEEYLCKQRESHKGDKSYNYGKHLPESTKQKISESNKGQIPWNKGLHLPERYGENISKSKMGHSVSKETREKISISLKKLWKDPNYIKKCGIRPHELGVPLPEHVKEKIRKTLSEKMIGEKNPMFMMKGEKHPNWKGGVSFNPYCPKFDKSRKKATRKFFNYSCIACGKHESENITKRGQYALPVHHIDHDKNQGCNDIPFNLVPLCHDCHGDELHNVEEYKKYINKTLEEGFKWGIWSREQYKKDVMY